MQNIETLLKENQIFIGKTAGDSMAPMLIEGQDTVIIVPPTFPLQKGDVPVYRRDGHYTMHRIVSKTRRGYIICGDNRRIPETDITDADIVGVLAAFYKGNEYIDTQDAAYRAYVRRKCRRAPLCIALHYIRRAGGRMKKFFKRGV